jgi:VanZ family protein
MARFLRSWLPAIVWACVIFVLSTDSFSYEHTAWLFEPPLRWMFPHFTGAQVDLLHYVIRKFAHFTEYFIFCIVLFRSVRGQRIGWRWSWGLAAWALAAGYSALDEVHQAFVASRHASPYDSLIDSLGALAALATLALWFRFNKPPGGISAQVGSSRAVPQNPLPD